MKKSKVFLFLLVIAIAASPLFAAGGQESVPAASTGPVKLTISFPSRPVFDPTQPAIQEIFKRNNVIVEVLLAENTADAKNLMFASGNLPDIFNLSFLDYLQYMSLGYFKALDDMLPKYGPNILKNTSADGWKFMTINGKKYGYPYEANKVKHYAFARVDWIKNVGIDLSKNKDYGNFGGKEITLDQYRDMLNKFTKNNPTKTGSKTYGMGSTAKKDNFSWNNIYGAFGGIPGHYYINNDKAMPWLVTDQYRKGLEYLNALWKDGVIDPEIYLNPNDQAKQKMINSVSGSVVGEWWSTAYTLMVDGLKALVPDAEFIPIWITSNDGKTFGSPDNGLISTVWSISTTSKNPEKALSFMDFFNTDEGFFWAWYGLEGTDFTLNQYKLPVRTEEGLRKYNNMIIDPFFGMSNRLEIQKSVAARPGLTNWTELQRQKWEILQCDNTQPTYTNAMYGIPAPKQFAEFGVDVNNWMEQSAMAFVTGEVPLNDANWNNYINTWKKMGGVKILQGYVDSYNKLKGAKITAGITE